MLQVPDYRKKRLNYKTQAPEKSVLRLERALISVIYLLHANSRVGRQQMCAFSASSKYSRLLLQQEVLQENENQ